MSKEQVAVAEFASFDDFSAADTSDMSVVVNGRQTDWVWSFAGPGHPKAIEQSNRISREKLHQDRQIEQQRLNGKKVKLPEETVDELRSRNVEWIVGRLVGWSPVKIAGELYPFSEENARRLLSDQKNIGLLTQAVDFVSDDASFTKRSAPAS